MSESKYKKGDCRANNITALEERFWMRVDRKGPSDCWEWLGSTIPHGKGGPTRRYGALNVNGKPRMAHRVAWMLAHGEFPTGLTIDHLCMNKLCVNPAHLEPVSTAENTRRWAATITHCPRGHEYNEANTRISKTNKRACRACARIRHHIKKARRLAEVGE